MIAEPFVAAANRFAACLSRIPDGLIALVGRISIAAIFWRSGQTKIEGFTLDPQEGRFEWGWPKLADSAVFLFREEYRLPLVDPQWAALAAAVAEHLFPALLLFGLATRFAALGLLIMTAVIQFLVYPEAWPTHGVWAAVLLQLLARGAGELSLDHLLARRTRSAAR
ncbi:MAG: hypothetical protein KatS3mg124_2074 [Porticoccaceae bacterium]|nr:MAG: hypothetical protein KatS3mg124_2074 [Porticoccaceae bacterium]